MPEFLYAPAYDDKGRASLVEVGQRPKFVQKGIREPLLCEGCEGHLNTSYEQPISTAWGQLIPDSVSSMGHALQASYREFKLFHLSILWRASVAQDKTWAAVSLGPKHEERIRKALISGDAPDWRDYPIFGIVLLLPEAHQPCFGWVMSPTDSRFGASRVYVFMYGGCLWWTVVGSHSEVHENNQFVLRSSGQMGLPVYSCRQFQALSRVLPGIIRSRGRL